MATIVLACGVILFLITFYKWGIKNNKYFEKLNVAYIKPTFLFGSSAALFLKRTTVVDFVIYVYNAIPGKKIYGMFDFRTPLFVLRDPEIVKKLCVKDFDHFEDHRSIIDNNIDSLFGNSLFLLKGSKWRDMRATLSPAFTGSRMRQMFELVSECANEMTNYFVKKSNSNDLMDFEVKDIYSRYANDVIATSAFGIKVNSFEDRDNEFYKTGQLFSNFRDFKVIIRMVFLRTMPIVAKTLKIQFFDQKIRNFFRTMVLNNIDEREKKQIFRPDMINLLMNVRRGNDNVEPASTFNNDPVIDGFATVEESTIGIKAIKRKWNDDEIVAQCFLFFLAGFDTTSTLLTFATYELTKNPHIQQKLYEEIKSVHQSINGRQIDYDSLQKMTYMDMVISETLRLWPPAPVVDRLCVKDYLFEHEDMKNFKISKDDVLFIPIYGFHLDPNYFPNPEQFNPDRFSSENKDKIIPGTYLPFGVGPRNCIGSRFALMEIKAILYYLLLNFSFEVNRNTQIPLKLIKHPFALTPEKPVNVTFKLRAAVQ